MVERKQEDGDRIPQSIVQSEEDDTVRIDNLPFCCCGKTTGLPEVLSVLELLLRASFCLF
jgi:hypothetical protein